LAEPRKEFLGIGVTGVIGTACVVAAAIISGLPQALLRFVVELVAAGMR